MKNETTDRIGQAISSWNTKEDNLKALFRNENLSKEKHFVKEKMRHFIDIKRQFKNNVEGHERSTYNNLKGEIKRMEHQLYPKRLERVLARLTRGIGKLVDDRMITPLKNRFNNRLQSPDDTFQKTNQQTVSNDQNQKVKLDTGTIQQQKDKIQAQRNVEPLRHNIVNGLPRNENKTNKNNLKNSQEIPKLESRPRHRLR